MWKFDEWWRVKRLIINHTFIGTYVPLIIDTFGSGKREEFGGQEVSRHDGQCTFSALLLTTAALLRTTASIPVSNPTPSMHSNYNRKVAMRSGL